MSERLYTKEDSDEVRRIYFEAIRKNKKKDERKIIVTNEVWLALKARGADMSRYERYSEYRKKYPQLPFIKERPLEKDL